MRVAIVKLSALGDIVHAMVALQFMKRQLPELEIDWIVEERFAGVLQFNPDIRRILTVNLKSLKDHKLGIIREIRKVYGYAGNRYDLAIDAQGLIKSAITARLLTNRVAGFDKHSIREKAASWFYDTKVECAYHENTIDRNAVVLSKPLGFTITYRDIYEKQPFLYWRSPNPELDRYFLEQGKTVVMVIGSTWESRNYPAEKFVRVAQALQTNCLVTWGNAEEKAKAEWMAAQCATIRVLPKMDMNDLKSVIGRANLVIGNDTGPTHMAWALNIPSITIFGPTPVSRVYQTDINKAIKSSSNVNPYKLDKYDYSIRDIDEHTVIYQAETLLHTR